MNSCSVAVRQWSSETISVTLGSSNTRPPTSSESVLPRLSRHSCNALLSLPRMSKHIFDIIDVPSANSCGIATACKWGLLR